MIDDDIPANIRAELISNCQRSKCRSAEFSRERPTRWNPTSVKDPRSDGLFFSDLSAWDYIGEQLVANVFVERIKLDKPPDKIGYVMKLLQPDGQILYIKLQLAHPGVIGRSFHYSE